MAEETKTTAAAAAAPAAEEVAVSDVPVVEKPTAFEKEAPPHPEPELEKKAAEGEKKAAADEKKIAESASAKEESNKVDDNLVDPKKKALDEFKLLIQEALNKHEFTTPPPSPPPAAKAEEEPKPEEEPKTESCGNPNTFGDAEKKG